MQSTSFEAGADDELPSSGGMLCLPGGNFGCSVPREDTPLHGLFENNHEGKQEL